MAGGLPHYPTSAECVCLFVSRFLTTRDLAWLSWWHLMALATETTNPNHHLSSKRFWFKRCCGTSHFEPLRCFCSARCPNPRAPWIEDGLIVKAFLCHLQDCLSAAKTVCLAYRQLNQIYNKGIWYVFDINTYIHTLLYIFIYSNICHICAYCW